MKNDLRTIAIGGLGAALVMVMMGQGPMAIRPDGIQFTDGTILTSADTRRAFYLTEALVPANGALTACASGFHMASLWEIFDVSTLKYAGDLTEAYDWTDSGATSDAGEGPPSERFGWIRTGHPAQVGAVAGVSNCGAWTSNSASHSGTIVALEETWDIVEPTWTWPWSALDFQCDSTIIRVWCVAD